MKARFAKCNALGFAQKRLWPACFQQDAFDLGFTKRIQGNRRRRRWWRVY